MIAIFSFFLAVTFSYLKSRLHWQYLKLTREELRKFRSPADFYKSIDQSNANQLWDQSLTYLVLSLPAFFLSGKPNIEESNRESVRIYIRDIRIISCLLILAIIGLFFGKHVKLFFDSLPGLAFPTEL
jgi:hypothetical protein